MYLAFYKGPGHTTLNRVVHAAVCLRTWSRYSHVELVSDIDMFGTGLCYSSSGRDGGVRKKPIDLTSGHWDVYDVSAIFDRHEEAYALSWFDSHLGAKYDYFGLLFFVVLVRTEARRAYFCSEAVAAALQLREPWKIHPQALFELIKDEATKWALNKHLSLG